MDTLNFRATAPGSMVQNCTGYYVTPTFFDALRKSGVQSLEKGWSDQIAKYLSMDALLDACAADEMVTTFFNKVQLKNGYDFSLIDLLRQGYQEKPLHLADVGVHDDIVKRAANMRDRLKAEDQDPYCLSEGNTHTWVDMVLFVQVENISQLIAKPADARTFYRNCLESCVHGLNSPQVLCSRLYEQFVSFS